MLADIEDKHNTEFPSGNLEDFLNDINVPKQDMNISQESVLDAEQLTDEPEKTAVPDEEKFVMDGFTSQAAAEMLVGIVDVALPAGLAWFAHGKTSDFQAEKDQRKTLERSVKKYLDYKGLDLPPGWLLLFLVLTIYGMKVPVAVEMRKLYKEESERQKVIDRQSKEIADLKKQLIEKSAETKPETTPESVEKTK